MKRHLAKTVLLCALFVITGTAMAIAAADPAKPANAPAEEKENTNPFKHIMERNVFGLKDPPPPAKPEDNAPPPPPTPLAKVVLTGILNVLGPPRALLEVTETEPGKQAGQPKKPILREGEKDGSIEVLSIDVEKSIVRIKNGTIETNLQFEALKQTGGAPAVAGAPPPLPALNLPPPPTAPPMTGAPDSVEPNGGRRGVTVVGGAQVNTAANGAVGSPPPLTMPTRQIRTSTTPQNQATANTDPVAQWVQLKAQEELERRKNLPFPPVPPLPGVDDGAGGQQPPPQQNQGNGAPPGAIPFPPFPGQR